MTCRRLVFVGAGAVVVAVTSVSLAGQAPRGAAAPASTGAWTQPRTPWGDPDLQGLWRGFMVPLERPNQYKGREFLTDEEIASRHTAQEDHAARTAAGNTYEFFFRAQANVNNIFHYDEKLAPISRRTSQIIDPPNGRLPLLTQEAAKRWEAREAMTHGRGEADSWIDRGLSERCIEIFEPGRVSYWGLGEPPVDRPIKGLGSVEDASVGLEGGGITNRDDTGFVSSDSYRPVKRILQSPGFVAVLLHGSGGTNDVYRIVPLDGRRPFGPIVRQYQGSSRGHWEGGTLVIETTNLNDAEPMMAVYGIRRYPGTRETLRVVERYTRVDADHLEYRYTVEDPQTYSRPYTSLEEFARDDAFVVAPGLCHENNKDTGAQLSAARADEAAATDFGAEYAGVRRQRLDEVKAEVGLK